MLAWLVYALCVSLVLAVAGFAAERVSRLRRRPTRWIWLLALAAAVTIPAIISFVAVDVSFTAREPSESTIIRLRETTARNLSPERWVAAATGGSARMSKDIDSIFLNCWLTASSAVVLLCIAVCGYWTRRLRGWRQTVIDGVTVCVGEDVGPAVVGFLRPAIVVPQWLLESAPATRTAVIAHERQHIAAGDPQLLLASLVFPCLMPWNLPLWWMVVRLRRAMEIDCDARVVREGQDPSAYGCLLLAISERRATLALTAVALTEPTSFLETRIRLLLALRSEWWRWSAAAFAVISVLLLALAAQIGPPNAFAQTPSPGTEKAVRRIVADLQVGKPDFSTMLPPLAAAIRRGLAARQKELQGYGQLQSVAFSQVTSTGSDVYKVVFEHGAVSAAIRLDADGKLSRLAFDEWRSPEQKSAFAQRFHKQLPTPGAELVLRQFIDAIRKGEPNYQQLSPGFSETVRQQLASLQLGVVSFGALQSITFDRVLPNGWDAFSVRFDKAVITCAVELRSDGKISGLLWDM